MKAVQLMNVKGSRPIFGNMKDRKHELMKHKKRLARVILQNIEQNGWNQVEAAKHFGIHNSQISRLNCGHLHTFSIDYLLTMLSSLGYKSDVNVFV